MEPPLRCPLPAVREATSSIYGSWKVITVPHLLRGQGARPAGLSLQVPRLR